MTRCSNSAGFNFLLALVGVGLLGWSSLSHAQVNVTAATASEGDFILGQQTATYSFTITGTTPGISRDQATVKPYWYIIYATGTDIYGNPFYQILEQGLTQTLYGPTNPPDGAATPATSQTFSGRWGTGDSTLLNYYPLRAVPTRYSAHRIVFALYGDGDPLTPPSEAPIDDAAFAAPSINRTAGAIYFYTNDGPDLAVEQVTYNAGSYTGGDIIRMTTKWKNNFFTLIPQEVYKIHNYLTENAAIEWRPPPDPLNPDDTVRPDNDDFLLSEYLISGDRPVDPLDNTPITPDDQSIVRKIEVAPVAPLVSYGIPNRNAAAAAPYYGSTLRVYQPQPDDGYLDVGEVVSVTVEVKVPENYSGTYFVAGRVDPENTVPEPPNLIYVGSNLYLEIQDPALRRKDNNTFISNASAKITIDGPTTSPTVEAVSAIAFEDGQYVQGGGETSNQSSVSADGNVIAFSSAARNLLVPPQLGQQFVELYGRRADMAEPSTYNPVRGGLTYSQVEPYLVGGQQIYYRLRQTRENYLASGLAGIEANANCFNPSISSATGRYIAFDSRANNLGERNTGNRSLIYISDVQGQTIKAIRPDANGDCFNPSISANGRFVAFESLATNLDASKPIPAGNTSQQIYLHDRDKDGNGVFDETGQTATYLVSVNSSGQVARATCLTPSLSAWEPSRTGVSRMFVAFVSYDLGLAGTGGQGEQVYRAEVNVGAVSPGVLSIVQVSINSSGDAANKATGAPNGSIEPSISGNGSQVAFSSSAYNLVYNPVSGSWDGDTNDVPDVFVRNFTTGTTTRVSESIERVATGIISFVSPTLPPYRSNIDTEVPPPPGNLSLVNLPQNNPQPGDTLTITSGGATETFVFGTDVVIGPDVPVGIPQPPEVPQIVLIGKDACATRDNLVNAINARSGALNIVAAATTPTAIPGATPPNMAISASIYLRSLVPGPSGNGSIVFTGVAPVITGINPQATAPSQTTIYFGGGGTQAEDAPFLDPANPPAGPPVQGVPAGSNQPSISEDGRVVAFRSIAYNLNVQALTPENNLDGGPPYVDSYPPSPRQGELLRPFMFPSSNVYVRNRAVDSSLAAGALDIPGNVATTKISANDFGYPTTISAQQSTGIGSLTTAANQAPAVGGDGRIISFSSGSEVYGGLVFGRNNLEPLDFQNARDVYIYDSQIVGVAPPPTESRPEVTLISPEDGLRVATGSTIALGANVIPKLGKSIASVQFYVNGAAVGAPLNSEPYSVNYRLANPGQYVVVVVATDSRGVTGVDSAIISAGDPIAGASPTVAITQPPSQVSNYVALSDLVFNAVAEDSDGTVSKVIFYFGGDEIAGIKGFDGNWFAPYRPNLAGTFALFAMAVDDDGNASVSDVSTVTVYGVGASFPSLEIIENSAGLPVVAGGVYPLRARIVASVPGLTFNAENSGVLFYADVRDPAGSPPSGVYLGLGVLQADGTYLLNWTVPPVPRKYTKIYAYLSSPNRLISVEPEEYANSIVRSKNSISLTSVVGSLPAVSITTPKTGAVTPQTTLTVAWTSGDLDGSVQTAEVLVNGLTGVDPTGSPMVITRNAANPASNPGSNQFQFFPPSEGVYTFVVRVTDNVGTSRDSTPVVVTVNNAAPTVLPEVDLTQQGLSPLLYVEGSEIFLKAAARAYPTNLLSTVSVYQGVQPLAVYSNLNVPSGVFGARSEVLQRGGVEFTAEAEDTGGNVAVGSTAVEVLDAARPLPRVAMVEQPPGSTNPAGGLVKLQAEAVFPATASTNAASSQGVEFYVNGIYQGTGVKSTNSLVGQDIYEYAWRTPTNAASWKVEARAIALDTTLTNYVPLTPFVTVSPTYNFFASAISQLPLFVTTGKAPVPVVSIKSPVDGTSVPVGSAITLQATASVIGSTIKRVVYYANGEPIAESLTAADSYSVQYTTTSKGEVLITAVAETVKGILGQSAPVKIQVPDQKEPKITFLSPQDSRKTPPPPPLVVPPGTTFTAAVEVEPAVYAGGIVAPIRDVRFFLNEVQVGEPDTTAPYSQQITLPGVGNYFLKAIATDIYGSSAARQEIVTCVNPSSGNPPIITMTHPTPGGGGDTQNDFSTPSQFYFNAVVTLPGGVSVAPGGVKFFANGVPVEGVVNNIGNTYSVFWQPDRNGDYFITAQVTDTRGITGVSEPLEFIIAPVVRPLPTVDLLPLSSASATVGSRVFLQAVSNGSITPVARIDFYANGVLIGSRDVNDPADGSDTTTLFEWTPTVAGNYQITARAIQVLGEVGDNSIISASRSLAVGASSGSTPLVNLLQQPISESIYVHGSQLFLNATAVPRGGATMPDDGVTIYYAGEVLPAVKSGVLLGTSQIYTAKADVFDGLSNITVFATARDSRNAIGSSAAATLFAVRPLFPLPTVTMLPLLGSGPFSASEELTLRARAVFPATANTEARVEFYANGAYLGAGIQDPNNPTTYTFLWETPPTSGTYKIEARALALNFETNTENDNKIRHFGSVISLNSVTAQVEAIPGGLAPGSNEAFVVEMYQDLLYRDPSYEEWFVAKEALNAGVVDRASFVMNLMGFDPVRKVFSRVSEFGRTSMTAMLPFYRLGIAPTANQVETFLNLLEADETPLPITGDYSGVPDAPWGATYGMAAAMREAVLRSPQFLFAYPTVTSMPNVTFNNWLRDTMFAGVSGGDESRIVSMMNTIDPQLIKQGAAMAFRSELAWVALEAGYITVPEQKVQLEAATTILNFQLNGVWDAAYGKKNPYSKTVVQSLLSTAGVAGSGGNVAVFRGPARSYQGLVGNGLAGNSGNSVRSASSVTPKINGELRVTTSTSGTYSGTLTLEGGAVIRAKGMLNSDGSITAQWAPGLLVNLLPVEDGAARYLGGTLTRGSSAPEDVVAGKQIYSKDSPFSSPGNYTLSLRINPAPAATDRLQGSGYATVKIPATGVAKIAGRLADNTPFTASIPVWGATGEPGEEALLVHRILSKGAGSIGGQILRRNRGIGAGDLVWQTAPTAVGSRRALNLDATLSPYSGVLPATGTVLPVGWKWNAPFSLLWNGGDEFGAVGFMTPGTLFGSAAGLSLKINASSGVVGGSFTDTSTGAKYKVNGILDQGTKAVDGFFLTPQSSGRLEVNR